MPGEQVARDAGWRRGVFLSEPWGGAEAWQHAPQLSSPRCGEEGERVPSSTCVLLQSSGGGTTASWFGAVQGMRRSCGHGFGHCLAWWYCGPQTRRSLSDSHVPSRKPGLSCCFFHQAQSWTGSQQSFSWIHGGGRCPSESGRGFADCFLRIKDCQRESDNCRGRIVRPSSHVFGESEACEQGGGRPEETRKPYCQNGSKSYPGAGCHEQRFLELVVKGLESRVAEHHLRRSGKLRVPSGTKARRFGKVFHSGRGRGGAMQRNCHASFVEDCFHWTEQRQESVEAVWVLRKARWAGLQLSEVCAGKKHFDAGGVWRSRFACKAAARCLEEIQRSSWTLARAQRKGGLRCLPRVESLAWRCGCRAWRPAKRWLFQLGRVDQRLCWREERRFKGKTGRGEADGSSEVWREGCARSKFRGRVPVAQMRNTKTPTHTDNSSSWFWKICFWEWPSHAGDLSDLCFRFKVINSNFAPWRRNFPCRPAGLSIFAESLWCTYGEKVQPTGLIPVDVRDRGARTGFTSNGCAAEVLVQGCRSPCAQQGLAGKLLLGRLWTMETMVGEGI